MKEQLSGALSWTVARAAYPGVLVISLVLADVLLARGVPAGLTTSLAFVATLALTAGLERARPHVRSWNPRRPGETLQDFSYLALASVLQGVARLAGQLLAALVVLALIDVLGARPWPHGWSPGARVALALALADLGKYGLHRLAHRAPWLWRFHAEHHAPTSMYSLNGVRLHPVNLLWNLVLDAGVPLALGLEGRLVVLAAVLRGAVAVLQHANVAMRVGPLRWILSTPDLHQWHHSASLGESHANYGSTFIVWDVIFGTRRLPRGHAPASLGLADGAAQPERLWHQLVWPWCAPRASTCRLLRGWRSRAAG